MWRIKAAAVPIATVCRPVFCSSRAFSAWVSGGIGCASGAVVPVALLVVESVCTNWPVAPLLSGLPFAKPVRLLPRAEELRGIGIGQHQESIMLRYDVRLTPKPKGLDSGVSL